MRCTKFGNLVKIFVKNVVYVDSDWAGSVDRKSTSGGMVCIGGAASKHWSRTQKARALSSGEAEYYAVVTGSAEGLGAQSLATDLGWKFDVLVKTDSLAAKSVAGRRGLGRLRRRPRHISPGHRARPVWLLRGSFHPSAL